MTEVRLSSPTSP